jgi:ribosome production factor 1
VVPPGDEEVLLDDKCDEFAAYFSESIAPKVLITCCHRPSLKTHLLMRELSKCIPNSEIKLRNGSDVKKIIPAAETRGYTAVVVVNEDRKLPNGMLIICLPEGPSAHFKVSSFKRGYDIRVSL